MKKETGIKLYCILFIVAYLFVGRLQRGRVQVQWAPEATAADKFWGYAHIAYVELALYNILPTLFISGLVFGLILFIAGWRKSGGAGGAGALPPVMFTRDCSILQTKREGDCPHHGSTNTKPQEDNE